MLIRISLIVAIVAGLAVSVLNFVQVREKITTLMVERDSERSQKEQFRNDLQVAQRDLDKTKADLAQTTQTLEATRADKERVDTELAATTRRATQLTEELNTTRAARDQAQGELAAYKASGLTPEQAMNAARSIQQLQAGLGESEVVIRGLRRTIQVISNELAIYKHPDQPVRLPAHIHGTILAADPKWNFVVLNIGDDHELREHGELLVNRNGKLVAKIRVTSIQKDRSIANIVPGWNIGEVMEGDQVIPAHPAHPAL